MGGTTIILIFFTAMVAVLGLLTSMRPEFTAARGGKIMAFVALCILPVLSVWAGFHEQVERSTSTQFCLSCHVMDKFGKSLTVDDKSFVPAAHFQRKLQPCSTSFDQHGP